MPSHAQLHIYPSDTDGAVRIQILFGSVTYVDMLDFAQYSQDPGIYPGFGSARKIISVGSTTFTNAQLIDANNNGIGLLRSLWTDPSGPFQGQYYQGVSDCMTFVDKLVKGGNLGTGMTGSAQWDTYVNLYKQWVNTKTQANPSSRYIENNVALRSRLAVSSDANTNRIIVFPVKSLNQEVIQAAPATIEDVSSDLYQDPLAPDHKNLIPIASPEEEHILTPSKPGGGFSALPSPFENCQRSLVPRSGSLAVRAWSLLARSGCSSSPPNDEALDEVTFARIDGVATMVSMTNEAAVQAVGIVGPALGAAVVILDLVNGNWKGAAFGAAVSDSSRRIYFTADNTEFGSRRCSRRWYGRTNRMADWWTYNGFLRHPSKTLWRAYSHSAKKQQHNADNTISNVRRRQSYVSAQSRLGLSNDALTFISVAMNNARRQIPLVKPSTDLVSSPSASIGNILMRLCS